MLIEKVENKKIWEALNDLHMEDVAIFKSENEPLIASAVMFHGEKYFMVWTNIVNELYSHEELVDYLEDEEFGFAYYKPYRDLDIFY